MVNHTSICMCAISFACANAIRASICKRACFVKKSISLILSSFIFGPIGKLDGRDALNETKKNRYILWYEMMCTHLPFSDELLLRTFTDNGLELYGWESTLLYLEYVFPMELLENVNDFESFGHDSLSELGLSLSDAVSFMKHI